MRTRRDRIREAFEFVSALRYAAIELASAVSGHARPRRCSITAMATAKDKANLLIALLKEMGIPRSLP